jgi:glucose-6-phosphate 1-dehydrogenase
MRGQVRGYRDEKNVAPDSTVETYAAVRLHIDSWRWRGVPFIIRAGKYLAVTTTEVFVKLKPAPLEELAEHDRNYVRFRLSPTIEITIGARIKRGGEALVSEPAELDLVDRTPGDGIEPYERLLGDALAGDRTLFARSDFVEEAWRIVDPVLGDATPVYSYERGTFGPREAERLVEELGGWHPLGA